MSQDTTSTILCINGGSSSIKFSLYGEALQRKASGSIDRIGLERPTWTLIDESDKKTIAPVKAPDFKTAAGLLLDRWKPMFAKARGVGHRLVHGGRHTHSEMVTPALLEELQGIAGYDPDHLPAELDMIRLVRERFPDLAQVACFDTAFHATMPPIAQLLPIPKRFRAEGVRRYGFHGLSYAYLMDALGKEGGGRVVLAHLGNGASLAAVRDGRCVDTSMGFTPAGGIVMGTRGGDLDPGVAWYMMQREGLTPAAFNQLINHESGLLAISGTSPDMTDLLQRQGMDAEAKEAVDLFCYTLTKWIGAYIAVLGGLDTLVFSGGIGEHAAPIRSTVCAAFGFVGLALDEGANGRNAPVISGPGSKVRVRVIPTNEELMIAKLTLEMLTPWKTR